MQYKVVLLALIKFVYFNMEYELRHFFPQLGNNLPGMDLQQSTTSVQKQVTNKNDYTFLPTIRIRTFNNYYIHTVVFARLTVHKVW